MDNQINPAYRGQEDAIKQQLSENGFVLLAHLFETPLNPELSFAKDAVFDMHHYEKAPIPVELSETFTHYVQTLLPETTLVHSAALRLTSGNYTLQHDEQPPAGMLGAYFLAPEWDVQAFRGELTIAKDEPLLIPPQHNALALIKRTEDERVFIKRVTHYAQQHNYTVLLFVWE